MSCARSPGGLKWYSTAGRPSAEFLESTVVDLTGTAPRVLRPGLINSSMLADTLGIEVRETASEVDSDLTVAAAMPFSGLMKKHYSPSVPVMLVDDDGASLVRRNIAEGKRIGWLPLESIRDGCLDREMALCIPMPREPSEYARRSV